MSARFFECSGRDFSVDERMVKPERLGYSRRVRPEDFVPWGAGLEACLALPKRVKKLDAALAQVCCVGWG